MWRASSGAAAVVRRVWRTLQPGGVRPPASSDRSATTTSAVRLGARAGHRPVDQRVVRVRDRVVWSIEGRRSHPAARSEGCLRQRGGSAPARCDLVARRTTTVVEYGASIAVVYAPDLALSSIPANTIDTVRNTTNAGDAFAAGFLMYTPGAAAAGRPSWTDDPSAACRAGHDAAAMLIASR
jgi:hypothetical protein